MRALTLALFLVGCTPWTEFPDVEGPASSDYVVPGAFDGTAVLELRAYAGPVLVKREVCTTPISLAVDATAEQLVSGTLVCNFEEVGTVSADLMGSGTPLPWLEGTLDGDEIVATWTGWFTDEVTLYADTIGTTRAQGLRIEYRGYVQAERTGPLPGGSIGG